LGNLQEDLGKAQERAEEVGFRRLKIFLRLALEELKKQPFKLHFNKLQKASTKKLKLLRLLEILGNVLNSIIEYNGFKLHITHHV
jgi:hypothetical protein